jgi:hypothetical protein
MLTHQSYITCTATPYGYEILVTQHNNVIDDYSAGNCAHDSVQIVPLNDPSCLNLKQIKTLAHRTAKEMANDHNISHRRIGFDN